MTNDWVTENGLHPLKRVTSIIYRDDISEDELSQAFQPTKSFRLSNTFNSNQGFSPSHSSKFSKSSPTRKHSDVLYEEYIPPEIVGDKYCIIIKYIQYY